MKVFTRDYRITGEYHPLFEKYFEGLKPCVLDIETTGLSYARSKIILIGLLTRTGSGVKVTQFLAENHYEEHKVLDAAMNFLESEDIGYLITYNGAAFDIPFINARLEACFSDKGIRMYDFDLFRFIKNSTDIRSRTGSLKQVAVENYFGILEERDDSISGRESIALFDEYALSGNSVIEKIILTHNREDVLHLNRLMYYVLKEADMYTGFDSALASYGFPIMGGRFIIKPSLRSSGRGANRKYELRINGEQLSDPISAALFPDMDSPLSAEFSRETRLFSIVIPAEPLPEELATEESICYLDAAAAGIDAGSHPDCINDYLILKPGSINYAASLITEAVAARCEHR